MLVPFLALTLAAAADGGAPAGGDGWERIYPRRNTWDLDLRLDRARVMPDGPWRSGVRARAGILLVREPLFWAVGPSLEWRSGSGLGIGVGFEVTDGGGGGWLQLGAQLEPRRHGGSSSLALGWSLFGLEARRELGGASPRWVAAAVLRLPVRIFLHYLEQEPRRSSPP